MFTLPSFQEDAWRIAQLHRTASPHLFLHVTRHMAGGDCHGKGPLALLTRRHISRLWRQKCRIALGGATSL